MKMRKMVKLMNMIKMMKKMNGVDELHFQRAAGLHLFLEEAVHQIHWTEQQ